MKRRPFKHPEQQLTYDTCRRLAADKGSELYLADGSPRRGANVRVAYWAGRMGEPTTYAEPGNIVYAAWAAGADDREEIDGLKRGPTWREFQALRRTARTNGAA